MTLTEFIERHPELTLMSLEPKVKLDVEAMCDIYSTIAQVRPPFWRVALDFSTGDKRQGKVMLASYRGRIRDIEVKDCDGNYLRDSIPFPRMSLLQIHNYIEKYEPRFRTPDLLDVLRYYRRLLTAFDDVTDRDNLSNMSPSMYREAVEFQRGFMLQGGEKLFDEFMAC
jgi:hypothetical protein